MDSIDPPFVSVHALDAGHLTLPESFFVSPLDDPTARKTVPSLSFLIQHTDSITARKRRIVFDLGIRRSLEDYAESIYRHALTRMPCSGKPDVVESLRLGGFVPDDIDMVILSHLHWDHIGMPSDFPNTSFIVGAGAAGLIDGSRPAAVGSHNHFEHEIISLDRLIELPPTSTTAAHSSKRVPLSQSTQQLLGTTRLASRGWEAVGLFEHAIDVFEDRSLFIVSSPGHLDGHINLLCRLSSGKYVYLAGDACHDARLLSGEKEIATWYDDKYPGAVCCIHTDKQAAQRTLGLIRDTQAGKSGLGKVEVVFAHDAHWEAEAKRLGKFLPGSLC
ncbi:unnamed protein product [Clonostachys rhizophaga]|uniref:Metallo-beta-lactamase domain-containing protein n=1 Tax=Clonostachys rhizophaga TaxID=160324 RepID=A0A9N9VRN3_9HYPO|nr:unnamed protein product [Clonostachys rhizophaga]